MALFAAALLTLGMLSVPAANAATLSLKVLDVSVKERNATSVVAKVRVQLSAVPSRRVTVAFTTVNGSAVAHADYARRSGTIAFPAGVRTKTVRVRVKGDLFDENNEAFRFKIWNPHRARIADAVGQVTVLDNDPPPRVSVADVEMYEEDSGAATMAFSVTLSAKSGRRVSVPYTITPGSATLGGDYSLIDSASGTLRFPAGTVNKTLNVAVLGDTADETPETVNVSLTGPVRAALSDGVAVGSILNDDGPGLAIDNQPVIEGNTATLHVTVPSASPNPITVDYATEDGTARSSSDYTAKTGVLTFPPYTTSQTITLSTVSDATDEEDEYFYVNLSNPTNASMGDPRGYAWIYDNDGPDIAIDDASKAEGSTANNRFDFTVSLSASSPQPVAVNYATANGTASQPGDYTAASGVVTFSAGETSKTVSIHAQGDLDTEDDETFSVNLSSPVDGFIADGQGVGTIVNDDCTSTDEGRLGATYIGDVDGDTGETVVDSGTQDICAGDADWYRIDLSETQFDVATAYDLNARVYLDVSDDPAQTTGDLDMQIYDSGGALVATAVAGGADNEEYFVRMNDDTGGGLEVADPNDSTTFYVKVYSKNEINDYRLWVHGNMTGTPIVIL